MRNSLRQSLHLGKIALKHRLDLLIPRHLPRWWQRLGLAVVDTLMPRPGDSRGVRLREAFFELGPVYIKFGQLLSTRRDLLPADIADELALLQDTVPPIPDFNVRKFVAHELTETAPEQVFAEISDTPLASASIAQIYEARLVTGESVVIKLVRPGIEQTIRTDMNLLRDLADLVDRKIPDAHRLHLPRVVHDHEAVLLGELDMRSEAGNQLTLRRNFADSDLLYVPRVFSHLTTRHMLVMERVHGTPISHIDSLRAQNVDLRVLAHKGVETFFTQVFEHNFFHADMHPGNILIDTSEPANPHYIALDCAIIGSLTKADQDYLAQNLIAFFNRDYRAVVDLHLASGWVPPDTDAAAFEQVIREVCDPIFAKPLSEIYFADFAIKLFQTAGEFNMEVQPQLVLLQKTLLYIEGLGRQLYPELDLWETAQPFMDRWAARRFGPRAVVEEWLEAGPAVWQHLARLPSVISNSQHQLMTLHSEARRQRQTITRIEAKLDRTRFGRRMKQVAGTTLIAISLWWLWTPLKEVAEQGDATLLAGVVGAILGSALVMRA